MADTITVKKIIDLQFQTLFHCLFFQTCLIRSPLNKIDEETSRTYANINETDYTRKFTLISWWVMLNLILDQSLDSIVSDRRYSITIDEYSTSQNDGETLSCFLVSVHCVNGNDCITECLLSTC